MADKQLIQKFQLLENDFNEVLCTNNAEAVGKYLSADWLMLEPGYGIITREQFLQSIEKGDLVHDAMEREVLLVKHYNNTAVVTLQGINKGKLQNQPFDVELWVTNVYKEENNKWVCVQTHESPKVCK